MARPDIKAADMVFMLGLETAFGTGSGASITMPAQSNGVIPSGTVAVASGGTNYPASKTIYVLFVIGGNSTAFGTVTTGATGVITSAAVLDGGAGYVHTTSTAATVKPSPNSAYGMGSPGTQLSTDDAVLIGSDMTISYEVGEVKRENLRPYLNAEETLRGENWCTVSFSFEMCPSGSAAGIPAWAKLFRIFGMAESITVGTKVEYTFVSEDFPSGQASFFYGAIRHNMKGIRGLKMDVDATVANIIKCKVSLLAIDLGMFSATSLPAPGFADWKDPIVITDSNAGDLKFGCTYSSATGVISGGVTYPSMGIKFSIDNTAKYIPMLGGSGISITDRKVTGECIVDQMAQERITTYSDWKNNVKKTLGFVIGNVVGGKISFFFSNTGVTSLNPEKQDGKLLSKIGFSAYPTVGVGNDELRVISM